jgi:hypothetical protein
VFNHLTSDGTERENLKRRDIYDIPKPKVVPNNLSNVQRMPSTGPSGYDMPPQAYGAGPMGAE